MPYFYHSSIRDKIRKEKIKFSEKVISYWNRYKHDSKRRGNWKLIIAKLHDIEIHFDGLNQNLDELKLLNEDVYYNLLEDYCHKDDSDNSIKQLPE